MDIKKFCIEENNTIISAITQIDDNHQRSIFVVNNKDKIIGVLSQGDIIRSIIEGVEIYSHVSNICNKSFIYLNNKDMEKAYKIFKSKNLSIIPVIDDDFCLTDIITINDIYNYLDNKLTNGNN